MGSEIARRNFVVYRFPGTNGASCQLQDPNEKLQRRENAGGDESTKLWTTFFLADGGRRKKERAAASQQSGYAIWLSAKKTLILHRTTYTKKPKRNTNKTPCAAVKTHLPFNRYSYICSTEHKSKKQS